MRIISGSLKGRPIKRPKHIRPTQDKVRKALFDILGDINGRSFLDLFAGSGAVGLEALSQGASRVVFVEANRDCITKIKQSVHALGVLSWRIIGLDAFQALKQLNKSGEKFEIIFLDPPYYQELAKKTLKILSRYDIVSVSGLIICQHFKKDALPQVADDLKLTRQVKYGDTLLSFYKKRG
jgi:16S rRNA (guanine(966)-N(2))-methyltransferase RsmD